MNLKSIWVAGIFLTIGFLLMMIKENKDIIEDDIKKIENTEKSIVNDFIEEINCFFKK